MSERRNALPSRTKSPVLNDALGREVLLIEALPLRPSQLVRLVFERVGSSRRQGVWVATDGVLRVGNVAAPQFVIWADTSPPEVEILCEQCDGSLRFYNVWDSGRGRDSQSYSSGMAVEPLPDGSTRYWCSDFGLPPDFERLIFTISIQ